MDPVKIGEKKKKALRHERYSRLSLRWTPLGPALAVRHTEMSVL